jgi:hypothetical protein
MAKKRGCSRFLKSEVERFSRVAQKIGASGVKLNPAAGTMEMVFDSQGEPAKADYNEWDEELYGKDQTQTR